MQFWVPDINSFIIPYKVATNFLERNKYCAGAAALSLEMRRQEESLRRDVSCKSISSAGTVLTNCVKVNEFFFALLKVIPPLLGMSLNILTP